MSKPFISVIIPAYNEAGRLPLTLIDLDRHLTDQAHHYEIIVVNDGSTDGTGEIMRRFASIMKNMKFINNPVNMGKAAALRIGMLAAKGAWCVAMDASNVVSIVEFTKALPYLKNGSVDIVVGSRRVRGARIRPRMPWGIAWLETWVRLFARMFLGISVRDPMSGFYIVSHEAAHRIFAETKFNRWMGEIEFLALASMLRYRIKELPVFASPRMGSHAETRDYLQIIWDIITMRWWMARKKYQLSN